MSATGGSAPYPSSGAITEKLSYDGTFTLLDSNGNVLPVSGTYIYTKNGPNGGALDETFTNAYLPSTTYFLSFDGTNIGFFGASADQLSVFLQSGTFSIASASANAPLINISSRSTLSAGQNLIAGFVIGGANPRSVLVRVVGPTLSQFGVTNAMAHTEFTVYSGQNVIASNTGWSSGPIQATALSNLFANVGAFSLPVGSADSATVLTLAPGAYTVVAQGVSQSDLGALLVEVYFVQ